MNRAASMRVFIYFFSALAVVVTGFFKVPSRLYQNDGLETSNCESVSPQIVICQSIVIIAIDMKAGQISMSN